MEFRNKMSNDFYKSGLTHNAARYINTSGNMHVDLGCGDGRLIEAMARMVDKHDKPYHKVHFVGVDANLEALTAAIDVIRGTVKRELMIYAEMQGDRYVARDSELGQIKERLGEKKSIVLAAEDICGEQEIIRSIAEGQSVGSMSMSFPSEYLPGKKSIHLRAMAVLLGTELLEKDGELVFIERVLSDDIKALLRAVKTLVTYISKLANFPGDSPIYQLKFQDYQVLATTIIPSSKGTTEMSAVGMKFRNEPIMRW